jgi:hypothetical protein
VKVYVELWVHADDEKNSPTWKKFFEAQPDVRSIEWCGTQDGCEDLTVYFKDSEEPFPISSLLASSCLKTELEKIIGLT